MEIQLAFYISLYFVLYFAYSSTHAFKYIKVTSYNVQLQKNWRLKGQARSALDCAGLCSQTSVCSSYSFNGSNNTCITHYIRVTGKEQRIWGPKSTIYVKSEYGTSDKASQKTKGVSPPGANITPNNGKAKDDISRCILYKQENITETKSKMIYLPIDVKPGMMVTVYGGYMEGCRDSQLTVTENPKKPEKFMDWFHIRPLWNDRLIAFTHGMFTPTYYQGDFPISDPTQFTLGLELTPSSTKIYADRLFLKSIKLIPRIKELYIRRFSKIYLLVIQKTTQGCEEVDSGIP